MKQKNMFVNTIGLDDIEQDDELEYCAHTNVLGRECLDCGKHSEIVVCPYCNEMTEDLEPCCSDDEEQDDCL